jgi:hypothetical protein
LGAVHRGHAQCDGSHSHAAQPRLEGLITVDLS